MKLKTLIIALVSVNVLSYAVFLILPSHTNNVQVQPKHKDIEIQYMQRKGKLIRTGADFQRTYTVNISKDSNASKVTISDVLDVDAKINRSYVFDLTNQTILDQGIRDGKFFNFNYGSNIRVQQQPDGKIRLEADALETDGKLILANSWVLEELKPELVTEDRN